jgi:hypothetical protein
MYTHIKIQKNPTKILLRIRILGLFLELKILKIRFYPPWSVVVLVLVLVLDVGCTSAHAHDAHGTRTRTNAYWECSKLNTVNTVQIAHLLSIPIPTALGFELLALPSYELQCTM